MQLCVLRGSPSEVGEGGEHAQRLLHRIRDQGGVFEEHVFLLLVFHQRPHTRAVGGLGGVVARRHEQEEAHHDLVLLELGAFDFRVHEHARQIVGGVLA